LIEVAMEYTESLFAERGKHHYTLSQDSLSITGRGVDVTIRLKGLEPEHQTVRRRSPGVYLGLIGLFVGLCFFVYGLVFNSEDMANMRHQTTSEQADTMLGRQVTVQVGEEEPLTGVVMAVNSSGGEPRLVINSETYSVQDVIHVKADRRDVFALAVISAVISLLVLFFSWRKVEFAIFKSTMGLDAISIARSGPDISTFHDFVEELSCRIRQVKESDAS
jgi:hypothetical protein